VPSIREGTAVGGFALPSSALVCGLFIGAFAAAPVSWLLTRRNLSWTWGLIPTALGGVAVWATPRASVSSDSPARKTSMAPSVISGRIPLR